MDQEKLKRILEEQAKLNALQNLKEGETSPPATEEEEEQRLQAGIEAPSKRKQVGPLRLSDMVGDANQKFKILKDTLYKKYSSNEPSGLISGNIDLTKRPKVQNEDGSYSTVRTMTITTDRGAVNIPTVVNGKVVSEKEAIDHYKKTGEHLGIYKSVDEAVKEAKKLHDEQAEFYGK